MRSPPVGHATCWHSCIIAGVFNFLGILLMGSGVSETIKKGVVDPAVFAPNPELLMLGIDGVRGAVVLLIKPQLGR